jgi:adenylate cyclase
VSQPACEQWRPIEVRSPPVADTHTFLFADLAGYTALTEAMGDEDAADVAAGFFAAVRELLPEHGAEEVKTIGDALMIRADEPAEAVRLALRVVLEVGGRHEFPIVRVGLHTGPATGRDGDWFGAAVNLAARVSGLAAGGEVLLTETTRAAAGDLDRIDLHERGRHELKNVAEPVLVFAAHPSGERSDAGLPIDPVCRMAVDPERCAGGLEYQGTQYYFCSLDCAGKFAAEPQRFVSSA